MREARNIYGFGDVAAAGALKEWPDGAGVGFHLDSSRDAPTEFGDQPFSRCVRRLLAESSS